MSTDSLAIFSKAEQMLAEADTIQKTKEVKTLALTFEVYARQKKLGYKAIQQAKSYALRADRKMGEMLKASKDKRAKAGRPKNSSKKELLKTEPTLEQLGISRKESHQSQKLAALPEATFEKICEGEVKLKDISKPPKQKAMRTVLEGEEGAWKITDDANKIMDLIDRLRKNWTTKSQRATIVATLQTIIGGLDV